MGLFIGNTIGALGDMRLKGCTVVCVSKGQSLHLGSDSTVWWDLHFPGWDDG